MVSDWMENQNINNFVSGREDVNRLELVCLLVWPHPPFKIDLFSQLADVARGLAYMHGRGMIHGDLKGVGVRR